MIDDLARQLRGIGMPVCNQAADALEAKDREIVEITRQRDAYLPEMRRLRAENESLRAEIEALKRDADRYKWLRNCSAEQRTKAMFCLAGDCRWWRTSEEMDTGIDVAMSQQEPKP